MSEHSHAPGPRPGRMLVGTPEQFRWLGWIVKAALVLNLLDAIFTLFWVGAGFAEEANPFMEALVLDSPLLFVAAKLGLVGLGSVLLWRHRRRPLAVVAIFLMFSAYYAVLLYHLDYLGGLLPHQLGS